MVSGIRTWIRIGIVSIDHIAGVHNLHICGVCITQESNVTNPKVITSLPT